MWIDVPAKTPCMRCNGRGWFFVRLGYPGQDPRLTGGYRGIKWQPTTGPYFCEVCDATGLKELRSPKQTTAKYMRIHTDGTMTHEPEKGYR